VQNSSERRVTVSFIEAWLYGLAAAEKRELNLLTG